MARVFFAKGVRGEIPRRMQRRLTELGFDTKGVDGVFGGDTFNAFQKFQQSRKLAVTGEVDEATYQALLGEPIPPVRDRGLGVTATFEGHDFTLAQGNFDGAGITWGIIGFTLSGGELKKIIQQIQESRPELVQQAFGDRTDQLLQILKQPFAQQLAFADSISLGANKTRLAEPWRTAFRAFGEFQEVQDLQLQRADEDYFQPALATAKEFGLKTELGLALAFDVHVQNGGIKAAARQQIQDQLAEHAVAGERDLRVIIANAVADKARPQYREDVRSRKLALATGAGTVHGLTFLLRNWGLDELPA
jgi:hypothetical protein